MAEVTTPQSGSLGNPVELHRAWISRIEWAKTPSGPWRKVPERGESGFPLRVKQPLGIYLRAVKLYPKDPWPMRGYDSMNTGEPMPHWEARYGKARFTPQFLSGHAPDVVHLQNGKGVPGGEEDSHLLNVTASAGTDKLVQLFIEPTTIKGTASVKR